MSEQASERDDRESARASENESESESKSESERERERGARERSERERERGRGARERERERERTRESETTRELATPVATAEGQHHTSATNPLCLREKLVRNLLDFCAWDFLHDVCVVLHAR